MRCHREIPKQRSLDFAKACSRLFFFSDSYPKRKHHYNLNTRTCSALHQAGKSTYRTLVMDDGCTASGGGKEFAEMQKIK